jgi:hypothetical protein
MGQHILPSRMSLPEVMGDPCAATLRQHALGILRAAARADKLIRSHPGVADDVAALRDSVERFAGTVLDRLAAEAGIPAEGDSISPVAGRIGDYRIDRARGCWIWMRSVTDRGYPIVGRKANGRENVPAKIYWMLARGPLDENEIVVRTCGLRLCINPDHGRVTDRREHGAERMREGSQLDWEAVHEIRSTLSASQDALRERATELAARFGVGEHSILDVFRNKAWFDADYSPGFEVKCAGPGCDVVFRTTSAIRRYHDKNCQAAAVRSRGTASAEWKDGRSPACRAREEASLRAEAALAAAEWSDAATDRSRTSVWSVASIDQPIGENGASLHDVLPTPDQDSDPAAQLEREAARELLEGVTEEAVAAMDDVELAELRARLITADMVPSTSRAVAA